MEDIVSSPPEENARKRPAPDEDESLDQKPLNLKGTQFMIPTPPDTDGSSNASPTFDHAGAVRDVSPAPSSTTLSSITSSNLVDSSRLAFVVTPDASISSTAQPPKKKRKLTPSEKIEQQREKEAKAAEKALEKARKLAEKEVKEAEKAEDKARKDEEKRLKDEDKRKKAEEKEEKKRDKELKEEQKVQDRLKKERSQMRLGAFFQKPATPVDELGYGETPVRARRKSLSLEPFDALADQIRRSESPCKKAVEALATQQDTPVKPVFSDYKKYFLPFQLLSNTALAPNRSPSDPEGAQEAFDHQTADSSIREKYDLGLVDDYASLERQFSLERSIARGLPLYSTRQLVNQINGSSDQPIDLTGDISTDDPNEALRTLSLRHISFEQDVRPAYFGTYSKIRSPRTVRKLSRNPFTQARPDTDYNYDSEAEWEEPEEGEDLIDEEEEEAESIGDVDEMEEFLDDEEDALKNKRKMLTGDLVPTNTGLCWEDQSGRAVSAPNDGSSIAAMRGMRMGFLLAGLTGQTIDPFSTSYWESEAAPPSNAASANRETAVPLDESMPPPRQPLQPRANVNSTLDAFVGNADPGKSVVNSAPTPKGTRVRGAQTTLSKEDMEEFKSFVIGSQASKADILKELKQRFPKFTNDAIKTTLNDNFAQVGATKAEKKWGFVSVS